jgi:uncharacterized membrane protein
MCIAAGLLLWRLLRQLRDAIRRAEATPVSLAVPVALAALLAHSFVDFDWSYAALFAMTAVLGGLVLGRVPVSDSSEPATPTVRSHSRVGLALLAVGVVTLALSVYTARTGQIQLNVALPNALSAHGGLG